MTFDPRPSFITRCHTQFMKPKYLFGSVVLESAEDSISESDAETTCVFMSWNIFYPLFFRCPDLISVVIVGHDVFERLTQEWATLRELKGKQLQQRVLLAFYSSSVSLFANRCQSDLTVFGGAKLLFALWNEATSANSRDSKVSEGGGGGEQTNKQTKYKNIKTTLWRVKEVLLCSLKSLWAEPAWTDSWFWRSSFLSRDSSVSVQKWCHHSLSLLGER